MGEECAERLGQCIRIGGHLCRSHLALLVVGGVRLWCSPKLGGEAEGTAFAQFAANGNLASVRLYDVLGNTETQANPVNMVTNTGCSVIFMKNKGLLRVGNPRTCVLDRKHQKWRFCRVLQPDGKLNCAPVWGKLYSISEQIE